jgi:hypothetical protein
VNITKIRAREVLGFDNKHLSMYRLRSQVTGHSLGGAVASIAAGTIVASNPSLSNRLLLVTFGQPRTGDEGYANYINQMVRILAIKHFTTASLRIVCRSSAAGWIRQKMAVVSGAKRISRCPRPWHRTARATASSPHLQTPRIRSMVNLLKFKSQCLEKWSYLDTRRPNISQKSCKLVCEEV